MITSAGDSDGERHLLQDLDHEMPGSVHRGIVTVEVSRDVAQTREGQLLLWMLVNLTSRMSKVVTKLDLGIPEGIPTHDFVVPFSHKGETIAESVMRGAEACARECEVRKMKNDTEATDVLIEVGDGNYAGKAERLMRASCDGWLAYVGMKESKLLPQDSNNPFGAFAAACIASGDVFKFLRGMKPDAGTYAEDLYFSSYDCSVTNRPADNPELPRLDLDKLFLVGCGAVGNALCHALYSTGNLSANMTLIDRQVNELGESEVVDRSNLDRYIMLTTEDYGKTKALALKGRMDSKTTLSVSAFDEGLQRYVSGHNDRYERMLSCVDTKESRHAIQDQLPRTIHGASTYLMSAQLSLYDMGKDTSCLKCYNELEPKYEPDSSIIARLRALDPGQREEEARKRGVDPARLTRFLDDPVCAELDEFSIQKFANPSLQHDWAVSFVSAMSGLMLAAEVCKYYASPAGVSIHPILDGSAYTDLYFNFWRNSSSIHVTRPREGCWCQGNGVLPRAIFRKIWG